MINENQALKYCCEDISLIENYNQAIADQTKMWDIHHRRECDDEGKTLFTHKQLKEMNLYYNRPASELVFVTRQMHSKIHREMCGKGGKIGGKNPAGIEKRSIPVLQFYKDGTLIREWPSINEAGRQLGIPHICDCLKGRYKSAGGFVWKYKKA